MTGIDVRSSVEIHLDKAMIPASTEVLNTESASISLAGISASVTYSNYSVNRNSRRVDFSMSSLKAAKTDKKHNTRKSIEFTWATPGLIPDDIEIRVKITNAVMKKSNYLLKGIYTKRMLVDLILLKPKSHFYFPKQSQVLEMPLPSLSQLSAVLQAAPNTTGWNITWPTETGLWSSDDGKISLSLRW